MDSPLKLSKLTWRVIRLVFSRLIVVARSGERLWNYLNDMKVVKFGLLCILRRDLGEQSLHFVYLNLSLLQQISSSAPVHVKKQISPQPKSNLLSFSKQHRVCGSKLAMFMIMEIKDQRSKIKDQRWRSKFSRVEGFPRVGSFPPRMGRN